MTNKDYDLNLWERNYAEIPAVQGEAQSRTINFHLKEEVNVQNALGNLEIRQKPVDITGYSAPRLYIEKTDKTKVFFDGAIADAANGEVSFTLPYQATTAAGECVGTVYLTKPDGTTLKAIGLTLNVQTNDLEGATESTSEFSALVVALEKADTAATTAAQAAADAQQAVTAANQATEEASNLPKISADGYWEIYNISTHQYDTTNVPASAVFAIFSLDPATGLLTMTTTDPYTQPTFSLNGDGELEVAYA